MRYTATHSLSKKTFTKCETKANFLLRKSNKKSQKYFHFYDKSCNAGKKELDVALEL